MQFPAWQPDAQPTEPPVHSPLVHKKLVALSTHWGISDMCNLDLVAMFHHTTMNNTQLPTVC